MATHCRHSVRRLIARRDTVLAACDSMLACIDEMQELHFKFNNAVDGARASAVGVTSFRSMSQSMLRALEDRIGSITQTHAQAVAAQEAAYVRMCVGAVTVTCVLCLPTFYAFY